MRTGALLSAASKGWQAALWPIEDPFETSRDLGRPLTPSTLETIRMELRRAATLLREAVQRTAERPASTASARHEEWQSVLAEIMETP